MGKTVANGVHHWVCAKQKKQLELLSQQTFVGDHLRINNQLFCSTVVFLSSTSPDQRLQ